MVRRVVRAGVERNGLLARGGGEEGGAGRVIEGVWWWRGRVMGGGVRSGGDR